MKKLIVLLALVFYGCGGPQRTVREAHNARDAVAGSAVPAPGKAMLVASLTVENLDFHRRALVVLPIYRANAKNAEPIVMRISNGLPRPKSGRKSDFADAQGKLFSVELAPGTYQLWPWVVYDREFFVTLAKGQYWSFTVKPGEVLYLGNFHFGLLEAYQLFSSQPLGSYNIEKVKFELRERFERDSQLLQQRYPALTMTALSRNGPKALPWSTTPQMQDRTKGVNPLMALAGAGGGIMPGPFPSGGAISMLDLLILSAFLLFGSRPAWGLKRPFSGRFTNRAVHF